MEKIIEGTAPDKFSAEHLKGLGFKSSNDRAIIPLLKDLGFLSSDGTPKQRYHDYRDRSRSRSVLGEALRETYGDLFHIREKPVPADRKAIHGKFKSTHNVSDAVAEFQTTTFFALLKLADLETRVEPKKAKKEKKEKEETKIIEPMKPTEPPPLSLRYNIEIHLPATKDIEVYNAIFKSLKEHLAD